MIDTYEEEVKWEGAGRQAVVPEDFAQNLGGDWGGTLGKKRHLTRYGGLGGTSPSPPPASHTHTFLCSLNMLTDPSDKVGPSPL